MKGEHMKHMATMTVAFSMLLNASALAQQVSGEDQHTRITVRGCLRSDRGNYILVENRSGAIYALQNVGNKLNGFLRKEIEVTGESKPGSVRTGVRPEKAGSNPADTVHGVDGVPLEVSDIQKDIRVTSKHCKAADQR
jgi:hypothetical protein